MVLGLLVRDLFWLFVCLEGVLLPMYVWVMVGGVRSRRVRGSNYLVGYTVLGGLFYLLGLLLVYSSTGSTTYEGLMGLGKGEGDLVWWLFGVAFATKIPLMPFHV